MINKIFSKLDISLDFRDEPILCEDFFESIVNEVIDEASY